VSSLPPGGTVLDVGCGAGTKSLYLQGKGLHVVGIDFSEKMIEIAQRENPTIDFRVIDLADVHLIPEIFDGVFMQAVLLHVPKKDAADRIRDLATKVKSGGYFYVAVKEIKEEGVEEEIKTEDDYGYPYNRFFSYYSMDELRSYFQNAGMRIVQESATPSGRTNWLQIIAQK
jgi:SAM-dependent methyltransferase